MVTSKRSLEVAKTNMENVIRSYGDFAYGSSGIKETVYEWMDCGFSAEQADAWLAAGCFNAIVARRLADAGMTPDQVAQSTGDGLGDYNATIGYKVANNDI
mgnify:FL=1